MNLAPVFPISPLSPLSSLHHEQIHWGRLGDLAKCEIAKIATASPNSLRRKGFGVDTWFIENFRPVRFRKFSFYLLAPQGLTAIPEKSAF
jgi:hypothetical protein